MDDISSLIKEAKPLYYKRKRTMQRVKAICLTCFVLFSVSVSAIGGYNYKVASLDLKKNQITNSTDEETLASYYPLDDYGLITVQY